MSLCVYKAKSLPIRVSQTIREEDRDFAHPGTVNPGKVTQRHRGSGYCSQRMREQS